MIKVAKINGKEFVINAELIEMMESTPDTIVTLTTGRKLVLRDKLDDVINRVIAYRKAVTSTVSVIEKRTAAE